MTAHDDQHRRRLDREIGKTQSQFSDTAGELARRRARWLGDNRRR